jgi:hypothetical protein
MTNEDQKAHEVRPLGDTAGEFKIDAHRSHCDHDGSFF